MNLAVLRNRVSGTYGAVRVSAGQAFAWWLAELAELLPAAVRGIGHAREQHLVVDLEEGRVDFLLRDVHGTRSIAQITGDIESAQLPTELTTLAQARGPAAVDVAVRVPVQRAIRRTLTLPLAAERNLAAVIGFELDRYTPFKADQAYYGCVVESRDRIKGTLQVALTVVARREVDPLLERLRRWSLVPTSLEVRDGGDARLNLLPAAASGASSRNSLRREWLLLALAVVLLAAVVLVPLKQRMDAAERLEQQVASARDEALKAESIRAELKRLTDDEAAIVDRRRQRASSIEVLDELTRLLPDNAWLNRFELNDARVTIRGEAANASELVKALEGSGRFRNAAFEGALTRDARTERERFSISAQTVMKP